MPAPKPYADSQLARLLQKRIPELLPKTQAEIAAEVGWVSVNRLSQIKTGASPMPIQNVFDLATALKLDPARVFLLTLDQNSNGSFARGVRGIINNIVTANEVRIIEWIRQVAENSDPTLTPRVRTALRAIFEK